MRLKEWLTNNDVSIKEFALRLDVKYETVRRYVEGERIPNRESMRQIMALTNWAVTANDFFRVEDA